VVLRPDLVQLRLPLGLPVDEPLQPAESRS